MIKLISGWLGGKEVAKDYYLAFKARSGTLMYLGLINNRPRQVGGKALARKFKSRKEAEDFKEAYKVNDMYQVVED